LVAAARHLEPLAIDDALDLFELLMKTRMISPARRVSNDDRLASLPRLERSARMLALVNQELFTALYAATARNSQVEVSTLWAAIEKVAAREKIATAAASVTELVSDDLGGADSALRLVLAQRYRTVRPFLPMLGESPALQAAAGGVVVLAAVRRLPDLAARKVSLKPLQSSDIDSTVVPAMWRRAVFANPALPSGAVDRDAYVVCVLEQLFKALRIRDVYAWPSLRWGDPRAALLEGSAWEAMRPQILDGLGLSSSVLPHLRNRVAVLDAAWRQMVDRMSEPRSTAHRPVDLGIRELILNGPTAVRG